MSYSTVDLRCGILVIFAEASRFQWVGRDIGVRVKRKVVFWSRGSGPKAVRAALRAEDARLEAETALKRKAARREANARARAKMKAARQAGTAPPAKPRRRPQRPPKIGCPVCRSRAAAHVCPGALPAQTIDAVDTASAGC